MFHNDCINSSYIFYAHASTSHLTESDLLQEGRRVYCACIGIQEWCTKAMHVLCSEGWT